MPEQDIGIDMLLYSNGAEILAELLVDCSSSVLDIKVFCRHVVTVVRYGLLMVLPSVPGALQPAK